MSLLIMALDSAKKEVYLSGDQRSTTFSAGKRTYSDNYPKVFKLGPGLYLGVSGLDKECQRLYNKLKTHTYLKPSSVIELIKNFKVENTTIEGKEHGCTFFLVGAYDTGEAFIWNRSTYNGDVNDMVMGASSLSVSTPSETTGELVRSKFKEHLAASKGDFAKAIVNAAHQASKIDEAISPSIDLVTINCLHKKSSFVTLKFGKNELV